MLSQQVRVQAKEPANLAEFKLFVDAAVEEIIKNINGAFTEAFRDKHTTKTGSHPSQLVFRALTPELSRIFSRIEFRHPNQFKDVGEINKAFDDLNGKIVTFVSEYFIDHESELRKLIGDKELGIRDGRFHAAFFYAEKISARKKKLFSLYLDVLRNLTVQRYHLHGMQPENLIYCDLHAQVCALSGNFRNNADAIQRQLNDVFSLGNIAEQTEYGATLAAVTEEQLSQEANLQRLITERKLTVSARVKENIPRIRGEVERVLSVSDGIQREITQYNRAYDDTQRIINDSASPCDATTARRLITQLESRRNEIQQTIANFNSSFAQDKSTCLQMIDAELRELPQRIFEPQRIEPTDLQQGRVGPYLNIERFLARLEVLSSGLPSGTGDNSQVVSIRELVAIRAQMVERLHKLEGQSEKIVESLIGKAASGYNTHLRRAVAAAKNLAAACDSQHRRNNPLWDAAKQAVLEVLVPFWKQELTQEKLGGFLTVDMDKAKGVVNKTRAEYQEAATIETTALERRAGEVRHELITARGNTVSIVNRMLETQCNAEVQTTTDATINCLTGFKDAVTALPVDQWRRGVNLRDPRNLDVNHRRQPDRPGFFRRHLGKFIGSGTGAVVGAGLGALAGFFLAPVTFGLSIPLLAAIGAVVGGAVVGGGIGAAVGAGIDSYRSNKSVRREAPARPAAQEREIGGRSSSTANLLRLSGEQPGMVRVRTSSPAVEVSATPVQGSGNSDRNGLQVAAPPVQVVPDSNASHGSSVSLPRQQRL